MATKTEVKKDAPKMGDNRPKMSFAFTKKNYMALLVGLALLVIGFIALSGGGSADPNKFSDELFSSRRMVVAPLILLLGYGVIAYAIMIREKQPDEGNEESN